MFNSLAVGVRLWSPVFNVGAAVIPAGRFGYVAVCVRKMVFVKDSASEKIVQRVAQVRRAPQQLFDFGAQAFKCLWRNLHQPIGYWIAAGIVTYGVWVAAAFICDDDVQQFWINASDARDRL